MACFDSLDSWYVIAISLLCRHRTAFGHCEVYGSDGVCDEMKFPASPRFLSMSSVQPHLTRRGRAYLKPDALPQHKLASTRSYILLTRPAFSHTQHLLHISSSVRSGTSTLSEDREDTRHLTTTLYLHHFRPHASTRARPRCPTRRCMSSREVCILCLSSMACMGATASALPSPHRCHLWDNKHHHRPHQ